MEGREAIKFFSSALFNNFVSFLSLCYSAEESRAFKPSHYSIVYLFVEKIQSSWVCRNGVRTTSS
jgi:hypothetical protein